MRAHYPWIWFDADGTLFYYEQAERIAIQQTFQSANIPFIEDNLQLYRGFNQKLWRSLEQREITPDILQVRRFELLLAELQVNFSPEKMSMLYVENLSLCAGLIDGAYDILNALHGTCRFAIVTNGLKTVQRSRLARSTIRKFIVEIIISEEIGASKPHPAFFEAAFARLGNPPPEDVLLIGDSLSSDIQGGLGYGLDTCWYNPASQPRPIDLPVKYEITRLHGLLDLVE